jgi:hypothetical protein
LKLLGKYLGQDFKLGRKREWSMFRKHCQPLWLPRVSPMDQVFPCARHSAQPFHEPLHYILTTIYDLGSCYSHIMDEETEAYRLSDLPKVIQQVEQSWASNWRPIPRLAALSHCVMLPKDSAQGSGQAIG